jgi:hypothetical protein
VELNLEAWNRWENYRSAIKKPIRPVSAEPMKLKLMRMGDATAQSAVVDQSIANQWQGLFDLKLPSKEPYNPHEPKKRSPEQQKAADASFEAALKANEWGWREEMKADRVIGELLLAEALLSRYEMEPDSELRTEKFVWIRQAVADRLRIVDAQKVLNRLTLRRLVLRLFNDAGLQRLEQRAKVAA